VQRALFFKAGQAEAKYSSMAKHEISAPLPGTFYRATSPNGPPAKADGAPVAMGEVIGVIEIMKTFTPVTAEVQGRRITLHVESEKPVMADQVIAAAEAASAFGDGSLYLEKVISRARHIEVQIFGDGENVVHLFERECSLQRRRQKVWEEAPAVNLPPEVPDRLHASAVALAKSVGYRGAGTVEFLYDELTQNFYFIEVTTRVQVEHPVTEMTTGIDLVQEMFKVAGGAKLSFAQNDVALRGHAIECRITAEDPNRDFMPAPGTVTRMSISCDEALRFDTMLFEGYAVPPFYDSLLGKIIVVGATKVDCLKKLEAVLPDVVIEGIPTNLPLHIALAADENVQQGTVHTRFLESWLESEGRFSRSRAA
jgi:acetyl-CoA carboxylase biotin carboxylase subunit